MLRMWIGLPPAAPGDDFNTSYEAPRVSTPRICHGISTSQIVRTEAESPKPSTSRFLQEIKYGTVEKYEEQGEVAQGMRRFAAEKYAKDDSSAGWA